MSGSRERQGETEDPVEIEWQFDALDLRPVERWLATLPTLSVETDDGGTVTALATTPRRLTDSYLDTADWRLARAGFVVRTRRRGRHDEITLKDSRPAEGNGLRQRLEVTEVLPPAGVSGLGTDGPVGRRLHAIVGARPLREVLQVRTRRRPFALRVGGVDAAEIALDDTVIVVGNGQRPMQLRRVEVEVQPDWLRALEPIVAQLRSSCGLQPAHLSKFEAGLLALGQDIPGSPDLGPTEIGESRPSASSPTPCCGASSPCCGKRNPGPGSARTPRSCTTCAWRRGASAPPSPSSPRCCPCGPRPSARSWAGSAGVLGAVRDLDVQLEGLGGHGGRRRRARGRSPAADHDPLGELAALLERERDAARADMLDALDSVRWDRLVNGLAAMVQQGPSRRSAATRVPAVVALPDLIGARHAAVAKAAKRAKRSGEVTDFHRLRIRCKRLRYALEFGSEVYGGRTRRYVRQLSQAPGRARPHAGRRGGLPPPGRAGHRRGSPACGHRLRDGWRGRAPPPTGRAPPASAARRGVPRRRPGMGGARRAMEPASAEAAAARATGPPDAARRAPTAGRRGKRAGRCRTWPTTRPTRPARAGRRTRRPGAHRPAAPALRPGGMGRLVAHDQAGVLGHDEVQPFGVEEALDVRPDLGEVRLPHVGAVVGPWSRTTAP